MDRGAVIEMKNGFGGIAVLALVLCLSAGICRAQAAEAGPLNVGIATADITPEGSVWMAGFGARKKPSEGVFKKVEASCLVFDNGVTRVGLMAVDMCKIYQQQLADIRAAAAEVGIPPQHMMINSSHTHSGPALTKKSPKYLELFKERTCGLLQAAVDDLQEAKLDYTVGYCTMAVNRRRLNAEGKYMGMRPEPRKPIDPDVPILRVLSPEGEIRAVMFGYTCVPSTIGPATPIGYQISPDYPGFARDWIAAAIPGCKPVFLQGCAGNVKPRYAKANGRFGYVLLEPREIVAEIGHELGRAVIAALAVPPQPVVGTEIGGIAEYVRLPDKTDPEKSHAVQMGAWRIGDVYIFGCQTEVLVQIGLGIKRELPEVKIWTNGFTFWGGGHIPPASAYAEGGYEVDHCSVSPASEGILIRKAVEYVAELQKDPVHSGPMPGADN